jgi:hypothetical protein
MTLQKAGLDRGILLRFPGGAYVSSHVSQRRAFDGMRPMAEDRGSKLRCPDCFDSVQQCLGQTKAPGLEKAGRLQSVDSY